MTEMSVTPGVAETTGIALTPPIAARPVTHEPSAAELEACAEKQSLREAGAISRSGAAYLDLARVIATNLVLVGHAAYFFGFDRGFPFGGLGVTVFFLLSGFLITLAAVKRWERPGPQFLPFMIDRCARIFVPFVPILCCVALLDLALGLGGRGQVGVNSGPIAFFGNLFLLNDYPVLQAATHLAPVADLYPRTYKTAESFWTIPIEFWTYVVFASFAFAFLRRERVSPPVIALLLAIALPIFLWNAFAGGAGCLSLIWIMGAVTAYFWSTGTAQLERKATLGAVLLLFGGLCLGGRLMKVGLDPYEFQQSFLIGVLLFGGFLMAEALPDRLWARTLAAGRIAALLAGYSYSLYLVHNTVLVFFSEKVSDAQGAALLAILAAHCTAFGCYFLFERRYRAVGLWLKRRLAVE